MVEDLSFIEVRDVVKKQFEEMCEGQNLLYEIGVSKDAMWNDLYLNSFPAGTNEIYHERREFDCNCCHNFMRDLCNVVSINDNLEIETIFDVDLSGLEYEYIFTPVFKAMREELLRHPITSVWKYSGNKGYGVFGDKKLMRTVGYKENSGRIINLGKVEIWSHFYAIVPERLCWLSSEHVESVDAFKGNLNGKRTALMNSLEGISPDACESVLDLIDGDNLYRGSENKKMVSAFKSLVEDYRNVGEENKILFTWKNVEKFENIASIRTTSIGTLLEDLTKGEDLETAVKRYEAKVAPENYKRSKAIFSQRQLEEAKRTVDELGYTDSFKRRFATADDINVCDIKFIDRDTAKRAVGGNELWTNLDKNVKKNSSKKAVSTDKIKSVSVNEFLNDILPNSTKVEALVKNEHSNLFASLTTSVEKEAKPLFKWGHNVGFTCTGNLASPSLIAQRVVEKGGSITGDVRCTIAWNDAENGRCDDDYDLHCKETYFDSRNIRKIDEIEYCTYKGENHKSPNGGYLDVDIITPSTEAPNGAVENITYPSLDRMGDGEYKFFLHNFAHHERGRTHHAGFSGEISILGNVFTFKCKEYIREGDKCDIAAIKVITKDGKKTVEICPNSGLKLVPGIVTKWGITAEQFVPVSLICHSPNYWENNDIKVGKNHLMFILNNCINDERPNGIFNEFLNSDLYPAHRKVMEALSYQTRVEDSDDQLSGLCFPLDVRKELVVKVSKGKESKVYNIQF